MSSNKKFNAKLLRHLGDRGFQHPGDESVFVPYIKRITKDGHIIINCPRDEFGEPFPGRKGSTYNVGGTSGDQSSIRDVASRLRKRGVFENDEVFCGFLIYNSGKNIAWDPDNDLYDFSDYPQVGDLIIPYPQPKLEAQMTGSNGDALLAKWGSYMRAPALITSGAGESPRRGWGYDVDGTLWAHIQPTRAPESGQVGTTPSGTWVALDPRDWRWEISGTYEEEPRVKRDKPL